MNDQEFREHIDKAVNPYEFTGGDGMDGYENAGAYAAKMLMAAAGRDPIGFKIALDDFRENPYSSEMEKLLTPEDREIVMEGRYGVTGFQWGWAVNAAAHLTEQAPVPNPAIMRFKP